MNELFLIPILLVGIMILMRKRRQLIDNPEPQRFREQPSNKSVTNDELDRVLMLMQISGAITTQERNRIYIRTLPFTKG